MTTWTTVNKPSVTSWTTLTKPSNSVMTTINNGTPLGLLLALTFPSSSSVMGSLWTDVAKPSGTSWTTYPKAT